CIRGQSWELGPAPESIWKDLLPRREILHRRLARPAPKSCVVNDTVAPALLWPRACSDGFRGRNHLVGGRYELDTDTVAPTPQLFTPHPSFSDEVNRNIIRSEIEGGADLDRLSEGAILEVETQNHRYTVVNCGRGQALICGHPQYCPDLVLVNIAGS